MLLCVVFIYDFSGRIQNMKIAQENGIHPVITIGQMGDGQYFANLAADKQKRSGFVSFLLEVLKNLPADGIYIQWMYPGCPNVI
jgi:GH18 family chitinase